MFASLLIQEELRFEEVEPWHNCSGKDLRPKWKLGGLKVGGTANSEPSSGAQEAEEEASEGAPFSRNGRRCAHGIPRCLLQWMAWREGGRAGQPALETPTHIFLSDIKKACLPASTRALVNNHNVAYCAQETHFQPD